MSFTAIPRHAVDLPIFSSPFSVLPHILSADKMPFGAAFPESIFILMLCYWPLVAGLRRLPSIPTELWASILDLVLSDRMESFASYNAGVAILCSCSPEWDFFIKDSVRFWTQFNLTCRSSVSEVEAQVFYVSRKTCPIDINILFDIDDPRTPTFQYSGLIDEDALARNLVIVTSCLVAVIPTVARWRRVRLSSTTDCFMATILRIFRDVPAPNMLSLLLYCPAYRAERSCDPLFMTPPRLFAGTMPSLAYLHLWNTTLPWGDSDYFGSIHAMEFGDAPGDAWPTAESLTASLVASATLTYLKFGGGGVMLPDKIDIPSFSLPVLQSITILHWSECDTILRFLAYGAYPILHHMTFTHLDDTAWTAVFATGLLRQLRSITISGWVTDLRHMDQLLRSIDRVRCIDIRGAHPQVYFAALASQPSLCPNLCHLSVGNVVLTNMLEYLARRADTDLTRLREVDYHHHLEHMGPETASLLSDIRAVVSEFNFIPSLEEDED
ncbi:hypothetical protein B0H16DRAFT_1746430 [Mycena metata]|uniref:F-box domain-containing protein n=1 Tax=Mycena metata TaxID=1033252 RepID=A0AAD7GYK1_9AGAR|nr:hypothetical protein B0H16DRAFT_1746430 [Mycena metata]